MSHQLKRQKTKIRLNHAAKPGRSAHNCCQQTAKQNQDALCPQLLPTTAAHNCCQQTAKQICRAKSDFELARLPESDIGEKCPCADDRCCLFEPLHARHNLDLRTPARREHYPRLAYSINKSQETAVLCEWVCCKVMRSSTHAHTHTRTHMWCSCEDTMERTHSAHLIATQLYQINPNLLRTCYMVLTT